VRLLESRLERLVQLYKETHGVDVSSIDGAGAAGGLAGGLLALGATLIPGFDMVADEVGLHDRLRNADLVITGEGQLDITSFEGKVVGGVVDLARTNRVPVGVVCGRVDASARDADEFAHIDAGIASLTDLYGDERAMNEPQWCIEHAALELLGGSNRQNDC
jgi:glycerate kinase